VPWTRPPRTSPNRWTLDEREGAGLFTQIDELYYPGPPLCRRRLGQCLFGFRRSAPPAQLCSKAAASCLLTYPADFVLAQSKFHLRSKFQSVFHLQGVPLSVPLRRIFIWCLRAALHARASRGLTPSYLFTVLNDAIFHHHVTAAAILRREPMRTSQEFISSHTMSYRIFISKRSVPSVTKHGFGVLSVQR
jgi:hypothetical protein